MLSNNLTLLTSTISTMSITKGAFAMVLKNSNFRISSVLLSNTLKNSTSKLISSKSNSNDILTYLRKQYRCQAFVSAKDATRQQTILRLSSLMNYHNSFRNSFSSLQSKKNSTFNTNLLLSKKNSQLRNDSTSISSSTKDSPSKVTSVEETSTIEGRSMTEKFKILTKKYGVSAVVVYLLISTLDLGLTFIIIQIGGADRVRKVEDWFTETFGNWIVLRKDPNTNAPKTNNTEHDSDKYVVNGNGNRSSKTPSWASTLVIAYGIHKLLVPFRLGLTAAVTPPIVKKLRRMGWNIGGKHM
ncbi:hypothetical protein RclHR1_04280011 [Rhizophagus clarus]|uniref:DUF1279 domain-containing protein n=1 Tax=Rhizophagus clarus TaxID=94130 RepID=A0A2Z6RHS6_9GLOM|nr:hypothetical protein RclHR1_04280011 [Rhizophagus clarus]